MPFTSIVFLVIVTVLCVLNIYLDNKQNEQGNAGVPEKKVDLFYKKKYYFFTPSEKRFFDALQHVINGKYIIFSKVRLIDLLDAPRGINNHVFYQHFNKIKSKHVDFVICDPARITPLLVIELDDSTHLRPERILRDKFVDEAFHAAGLQILHIRNKTSYDPNELLQTLKGYLITG